MVERKLDFRTLQQVEELLRSGVEVYGVDCFVEEDGTLVYCGTVIPDSDDAEMFLEKLKETGAVYFAVTWRKS